MLAGVEALELWEPWTTLRVVPCWSELHALYDGQPNLFDIG